jgi:hypothetical protein
MSLLINGHCYNEERYKEREICSEAFDPFDDEMDLVVNVHD